MDKLKLVTFVLGLLLTFGVVANANANTPIEYLGVYKDSEALFLSTSDDVDLSQPKEVQFQYWWNGPNAMSSKVYEEVFEVRSMLTFVPLQNHTENFISFCVRVINPGNKNQQTCLKSNNPIELLPPNALVIMSSNVNHTAVWEYNNSDVFYEMQYFDEIFEEWSPAFGCERVLTKSCNLFEIVHDPYDEDCPDYSNTGTFSLRVRACSFVHEDVCSPWSTSKSPLILPEKDIIKPPDYEVLGLFAEAQLRIMNKPYTVWPTNKSLNCYYDNSLQYRINYWSTNDSNQPIRERIASFGMTLITLPLFEAPIQNAEMCVKMSIEDSLKISKSDWKTICTVISKNVPEESVMMVVSRDDRFTIILAVTLTIAVVLICVISYKVKNFYTAIYKSDQKIPTELVEVFKNPNVEHDGHFDTSKSMGQCNYDEAEIVHTFVSRPHIPQHFDTLSTSRSSISVVSENDSTLVAESSADTVSTVRVATNPPVRNLVTADITSSTESLMLYVRQSTDQDIIFSNQRRPVGLKSSPRLCMDMQRVIENPNANGTYQSTNFGNLNVNSEIAAYSLIESQFVSPTSFEPTTLRCNKIKPDCSYESKLRFNSFGYSNENTCSQDRNSPTSSLDDVFHSQDIGTADNLKNKDYEKRNDKNKVCELKNLTYNYPKTSEHVDKVVNVQKHEVLEQNSNPHVQKNVESTHNKTNVSNQPKNRKRSYGRRSCNRHHSTSDQTYFGRNLHLVQLCERHYEQPPLSTSGCLRPNIPCFCNANHTLLSATSSACHCIHHNEHSLHGLRHLSPSYRIRSDSCKSADSGYPIDICSFSDESSSPPLSPSDIFIKSRITKLCDEPETLHDKEKCVLEKINEGSAMLPSCDNSIAPSSPVIEPIRFLFDHPLDLDENELFQSTTQYNQMLTDDYLKFSALQNTLLKRNTSRSYSMK